MTTGRPPKDADQRRNHVPLKHDWVDVVDEPFTASPALEELRPDVTWLRPALIWWETVRVMPHCSLWAAADWQFAATTALIFQELHAGDGAFTASMIGQLTRREIELGLTADARRQQRIRYVPRAEDVAADGVPAVRKRDVRARLKAV